MYRGFLSQAVQKRLNRSLCRLGCGLGGPKEAQVQSYPPGDANVPSRRAHWRHLTDTIEPSICGCDGALCQIILIICYILRES